MKMFVIFNEKEKSFQENISDWFVYIYINAVYRYLFSPPAHNLFFWRAAHFLQTYENFSLVTKKRLC